MGVFNLENHMQIELYLAPGTCSFVPHVGLEVVKAATGQDFVTHSIKLHRGEHKTPEYLAMNPDGQVPVLKVDGKPLTQIVAICDWIDRSFPQVEWLPADPWTRAQAMSRLAWLNNTVHTTFTHVFAPQKYAADEAAQQAIKSQAIAQYRLHLERIRHMVEHGRTAYLFGERVSCLDAYVLTLVRWGGYGGIDPESLGSLWTYVQKVADAAPVAAVMTRERLVLNPYRKP